LPLPNLVSFLLNAPRAGLQIEINQFFDHALGNDTAQAPTKSALCQARSKLKPEALRSLVALSAAKLVEHSAAPAWHGYRVLALDSTVLRVPAVAECAKYFGGIQPACGKFRPLARATALLDVARDCFVDVYLGKYNEDDRSLALRQMDALGRGDLVLMDRGYPSRAMLAHLHARGVKFCVRMPRGWKETGRVMAGRCADQRSELGTPDQPVPVRLLRYGLPNGNVLVLATNIDEPHLDAAQFAALYRSRWRIEECFKLIKARLQVENWSGVQPQTVEQDFYAAAVRINCAAIIALEADPTHAALAPPEPNAQGWRVALNCTLVIKNLRHKLPRLLLALNAETVLANLLDRLRAPGAKERTRPGRTAKRSNKVKIAGFHFAYKGA
jgi:hypothetical protein